MRKWLEENSNAVAVTVTAFCILALIFVWVPSKAEKDGFRTRIANTPPLGHWISTISELEAVRVEVRAIEVRANSLSPGEYTPEVYVNDLNRLLMIEKSLLETGGMLFASAEGVSAQGGLEEVKVPFEVGMRNTWLRLEVTRVFTHVANKFQAIASNQDIEKVRLLSEEAGYRKLSAMQMVESDYHAGLFFAWMLKTHIESMVVVFFFFLLRAHFIGQRRRMLVYDLSQTVLWMWFWPVGIFRYPTADPVEFALVVRHRLAMAMSLFFTIASPGFAHAQSGKANGDKKEDTGHTLIVDSANERPVSDNSSPMNQFSMGFEVVSKYHGMDLSVVLQDEPAPRVSTRYSRTTSLGDLTLGLWNSIGHGSNKEIDVDVGYSKSGWNLSLARYFVGGGDILQLSGSKGGILRLGKARIPLSATVNYYLGAEATSPPGGIGAKLSSGWTHKLARGFQLSHRAAVGVDNNPFSLGNGLTAIASYASEAGFKNAYLSWNASAPIRGQDNTTRGFHHSVSGGYRYAIAW